MNFTAYIEKDVETCMYVGIVPGIPGAHTHAENLSELRRNLKEVVELCLEEMDEESLALIPEFVGIQQVRVAA
jgi:predicted RNase H-like HicB family nuclease